MPRPIAMSMIRAAVSPAKVRSGGDCFDALREVIMIRKAMRHMNPQPPKAHSKKWSIIGGGTPNPNMPQPYRAEPEWRD